MCIKYVNWRKIIQKYTLKKEKAIQYIKNEDLKVEKGN